MGKLAVVSYPVISEPDRQWIEAVRARHDPQAALIAVHFTLVFPVETDLAAVTAHVAAVCVAEQSIPFATMRAEAVDDREGAGGHIFLIPDEGRAEITALHDRLYEGPLREYLCTDLSFVPHLTVGAYADPARCRAVVAELGAAERRIVGRIDRVDLVDIAPPKVDSLQTFRLGGSSCAD